MARKAAPARHPPDTVADAAKRPLSLALRRCAAVLILCLCAWIGGGAEVSRAIAESPGSAAQLLADVNRARVAMALSPLEADTRLADAATLQARHTAETGRLSHLGPDGAALAARVRATGYVFAVTAENLASGTADASRVVSLWLDSPGHRKNMLDAAFSEAGIGHVSAPDGDYWVLILAHPADW